MKPLAITVTLHDEEHDSADSIEGEHKNREVRTGKTRSGLWVAKIKQFDDLQKLKTECWTYFNSHRHMAIADGKFNEQEENMMSKNEADLLKNRRSKKKENEMIAKIA